MATVNYSRSQWGLNDWFYPTIFDSWCRLKSVRQNPQALAMTADWHSKRGLVEEILSSNSLHPRLQ